MSTLTNLETLDAKIAAAQVTLDHAADLLEQLNPRQLAVTRDNIAVLATARYENRLHVRTLDGSDKFWSECSEGWYPKSWATIREDCLKIVQPTAKIIELAGAYDKAVEEANRLFEVWGSLAWDSTEWHDGMRDYTEACARRGVAFEELSDEIIWTANYPLEAQQAEDENERRLAAEEVRG